MHNALAINNINGPIASLVPARLALRAALRAGCPEPSQGSGARTPASISGAAVWHLTPGDTENTELNKEAH
jgi:hypothetical protein